MRSGRLRSRGPESMRSSNPSRAQKGDLSDNDRMTYLVPRGILRSSRSASIEGLELIAIGRLIFIERRSRSDGWRWTRIMIVAHGIGESRSFIQLELSDGYEDTWKNSTIAVRSNRDRGAIEPRSWKFRRGITSTGSDGSRLLTSTTIDARSWPDRDAIV